MRRKRCWTTRSRTSTTTYALTVPITARDACGGGCPTRGSVSLPCVHCPRWCVFASRLRSSQERKREKKRLRKAYRKFQELDRFASERQALVSADVIVRT